ncbi:hypothetical protein QLQ12_42805 [Actinoplanes sp. NEAU-A12]|uniref:Uncharacterized protein n=1 Tax=Actinoplanes sandaracinus TaxID=3045177 RepID=A0ABT6X010_9ACTN|nr:hypothetical protein [Actinoplanes sandaracinus]MDI6105333.1 hypothetical protein [Actinoplanes sandaracinus]
MEILLDQIVDLGYGRMHFAVPEVGFVAGEKAFRGLTNGICGAAVPGFLLLGTGLRHGDVGLRFELHDAEPALDDEWEDVVEVSWASIAPNLLVRGPDDVDPEPVALPRGDYRVRFCGVGMQEGFDEESSDGEPPLDRYLLAFWPAPAAGDRIVRTTSAVAARHHRTFRNS